MKNDGQEMKMFWRLGTEQMSSALLQDPGVVNQELTADQCDLSTNWKRGQQKEVKYLDIDAKNNRMIKKI